MSFRKLLYFPNLIFIGYLNPDLLSGQVVEGKKWSLQECIRYAVENNIGLKQASLNTDLRKLEFQQSTTAFLPSLNASGFGGLTFGQRLDPFNLRFVNQRTEMISLGLNGNLLLFSGLQNINRLRQAKYAHLSAHAQEEQARVDLTLNVASLFLQVVFSRERLQKALLQKESTEAQIERMKTLVESRARPIGDLLNLEAQLASERSLVVQAENTVRQAKINLMQLLLLDEIDVMLPEVSFDKAGIEILSRPPEALYAEALSISPGVQSSEFNYRSMKSQLSAAKGSFSPTISFTASLGTGYSSLTQRITDTIISVTPVDPIRYYTYGGDSLDISIPPLIKFDFARKVTPLSTQFRQNFNNQLGVVISLPLLNNFTNYANLRRARIGLQNAELQLHQQKLQLKNTIFNSYNDAQAAFASWEAAKIALKAAREALEYAEVRLETGLMPSAEYVQVRNRYLQSETDEVVSRYELVFRLFILNYLTGKNLILN